MRVTNQQARSDISRYSYESQIQSKVAPLLKACYFYARDLLESREQNSELIAVLSELVKNKDIGVYSSAIESDNSSFDFVEWADKALILINKMEVSK